LAISNLSEEEQEYFDEEWSSNYSTIINAYTLLQNYINARKEVEELLLEENSKNRVSLFLTFLNNA
jgi:hypothetical protein